MVESLPEDFLCWPFCVALRIGQKISKQICKNETPLTRDQNKQNKIQFKIQIFKHFFIPGHSNLDFIWFSRKTFRINHRKFQRDVLWPTVKVHSHTGQSNWRPVTAGD